MTRPLKEIDQDYRNECAQIGHKQHVIETLSEQVINHRKNLKALNAESDAAVAAEKQEKPDVKAVN